jgi:hypothetical protein
MAHLPAHEISGPYLQPSGPAQTSYDPSSTTATENDPRQPREAPVALPPDDTQNTEQLPAHEMSGPYLQLSDLVQTGYDSSVTTENIDEILRWLDGEISTSELDEAV